MKVKQTVTVIQKRVGYEYMYSVKQAMNITNPSIGEMLTQSQVNALIHRGVGVTIKGG